MKPPSSQGHQSNCPTKKSTTKKLLRGLLTAFNPRAGDRGNTCLGMQSRKAAALEALIRQLDRNFLLVVLLDPPFRSLTHEKEDLICEVDRNSGMPMGTMVGEALEIPQHGHLGLERAEEAPASFSLVFGSFSELGRWPGAATVSRRSPLYLSVESLTL